MAKKGKKGSYKFRLGDKASVFYDPQSKVKILPNQIVDFEGRMTSRLSIALKHGHIVKLDADEAEELQDKLDSGTPIFTSMMKGDLLKYYVDNYNVSDEEGADFAKKTKGKMVEILEDLEEDADDDE